MGAADVGYEPEYVDDREPDSAEKCGVRFWHSPAIDKIAGALAKAQGTIENASKDATNPHFKSKYADLASVMDACRKPLSANEIAIIQCPSADAEATSVVTMLVHASGQFFASRLSMIPRDNSPQSAGSAITYARRYSLMAMAGIAPEDDDGNDASGKQQAPYGRQAPQRQQQYRSPEPAAVPQDVADESDIPHALRAGFYSIDKDKNQVTQVIQMVFDVCESIGPEAVEAYNKIYDAFEGDLGNRKATVQDYKALILRMWNAAMEEKAKVNT